MIGDMRAAELRARLLTLTPNGDDVPRLVEALEAALEAPITPNQGLAFALLVKHGDAIGVELAPALCSSELPAYAAELRDALLNLSACHEHVPLIVGALEAALSGR